MVKISSIILEGSPKEIAETAALLANEDRLSWAVASVRPQASTIPPSRPLWSKVQKPTEKKAAAPLKGKSISPKPCPICGALNKARAFSYICEKHDRRDPKIVAQAKAIFVAGVQGKSGKKTK